MRINAIGRLVLQDPEHGARSTLFAATQDISGGSYVQPGGLAHARGHPEIGTPSRGAQDAAAAPKGMGHLVPFHGHRLAARNGGSRVILQSCGVRIGVVDDEVDSLATIFHARYRKMVQDVACATGCNALASPMAAGLFTPWKITCPMSGRAGEGSETSPQPIRNDERLRARAPSYPKQWPLAETFSARDGIR